MRAEVLGWAAWFEGDAMLRLLLASPAHWCLPRADCQDGFVLVRAAEVGHDAIVRMLLDLPEHAPRADCRDGEALVLLFM